MFSCSFWICVCFSFISVNLGLSSIMPYSVIHDLVGGFLLVIFMLFNIEFIFTLKIQGNDACLEECHDGCGRIFD